LEGNEGIDMAEAEYVDLLVGPEHRIAVERELHEWDRQNGESRVWVEGEENGRLLVCDVRPAALAGLDREGIRYVTRARPAGRPLPVPVATFRGLTGA
jgi:hypothetical protein